MSEEFKVLSNKGDALASNKMAVGESVSGYVTKVATTPNRNYPQTPNKTIMLTKEDGKTLAVFASGNLRYLQEDLAKQGYELGSFIRITKVAAPKGSKFKNYFEVAVKEGDSLDLTGGPDENPTEEY